MKALLYKQFYLVAHPISYAFCAFCAMLLIPSYPYTVAYFYVTLGIFFTFQNAREQRDSDFCALLPVSKRDSVRAAVIYCVVMELLSILLSVPFIILSANIKPAGGNLAGIDANMALLGFAFTLYAIFNVIFLTSFYRTGYKVGKAFLLASIGVAIIWAMDIVLPHIIPWLDGYDSRQWLMLILGAIIYCGATLFACKKSEASFEKVDL